MTWVVPVIFPFDILHTFPRCFDLTDPMMIHIFIYMPALLVDSSEIHISAYTFFVLSYCYGSSRSVRDPHFDIYTHLSSTILVGWDRIFVGQFSRNARLKCLCNVRRFGFIFSAMRFVHLLTSTPTNNSEIWDRFWVLFYFWHLVLDD